MLQKRGITRVRPLLGGLGGWQQQQYPVVELPDDQITGEATTPVSKLVSQASKN